MAKIDELQRALQTDGVTDASRDVSNRHTNKNIMDAIKNLRDSIEAAAPDTAALNEQFRELNELQTSAVEAHSDALGTMQQTLEDLVSSIQEKHQHLVEAFTDAVQTVINDNPDMRHDNLQWQRLLDLLTKISDSPLVNANRPSLQASIEGLQTSIKEEFTKQRAAIQNGFRAVNARLDQRSSFAPVRPGEDTSFITIEHIIDGVAEVLAEKDIDASRRTKSQWVRELKSDSFDTFYKLATSIKRVSDGHGWKHSLDVVRAYLPALRQHLIDAGVNIQSVDFESDTMSYIARELEVYNS